MTIRTPFSVRTGLIVYGVEFTVVVQRLREGKENNKKNILGQ
jgi:hypothetical protein